MQTKGATKRTTTTDPRRRIGAAGEAIAGRHLEALGHLIITRNARTRYGEIDLISVDPGVSALVFTEVKTARRRNDGGFLDPLLSVTPRKALQVRRLARAWIATTEPPPGYCEAIRFDVIAIVVNSDLEPFRLEHIEAAF